MDKSANQTFKPSKKETMLLQAYIKVVALVGVVKVKNVNFCLKFIYIAYIAKYSIKVGMDRCAR